MVYQDFANIAGLVWHVTKGETDPEFGACAQDHQHRLSYKVESVFKSGVKADRFETIAGQLLEMPREQWGPFIIGLKNPVPDIPWQTFPEIDPDKVYFLQNPTSPTKEFTVADAFPGDAESAAAYNEILGEPVESRNEPEITEGFDSPKSSRKRKGE